VRLVLDTNVVIDWLVFDDPFLAPFRRQVLGGQVTVLTHPPALAELRRVLGYRALKLDEGRQAGVLARYEAQTSAHLSASAEAAGPPELPKQFPRCRDPDDNHFLALAYHAKANALVSRDNEVLVLAKRARKFGFEILNVPQMAEAVSRLAASSAASVA
jgi:uncharacterized protein